MEIVLGFFFLRCGAISGRYVDESALGTLIIGAAMVAMEKGAGSRAQRAERAGFGYPHLE